MSVLLRVPGSTSNLGTGFDALGLALSLYLEVRAEPDAEGREPWVDAEESLAWPSAEEDLLLRALLRTVERLDVPVPAWRLRVRSELPIGRGLGSSGAAVAAGLLLGTHAARLHLGPAASPALPDLLAWGIEFEGHPDNVAASLHGGCTLCVPETPPVVLQPELHPSLAFAVAWPEVRVETARAREVLPAEVPHADAVENARRLPVLLEGLRTADPRLLHVGGVDRLHVRHRLALVPGGAAALTAARAAGAWLATISGSGSTLFAIAPHSRAAAAAEAMARVLRAETGSGTGRVVTAATAAPRVETT